MVVSPDFTLAVATEPANASLMQIDDRIVLIVIIVMTMTVVIKTSRGKFLTFT